MSEPVEIVRVPFHGTVLLTSEVAGVRHIALKPAIEGIGLSYPAQYRKLQGRSWAVVAQTATTGSDGKTYQMVTVDVRTFLMLLATVNENQVAEDLRPLLVAYQREVADVIESYWTKGAAVQPGVEVGPQHQIPQTLSEALRMAADNLDRAELAEKQVAELETTTAAQGKELETARPKAEYVDAFVRGGMDGTPLRVLAGQLNVPERVLRQHLMDCGVIYRKFLGRRWSGTHQRHIDEYQYYAYSERRPWFVPVDLPNTPRLPGGQMRTALHVTPVGKVRILALLKRRPISNPPKGGAA